MHQKYTGVENVRIRENLVLLNSLKAPIQLRCPIIPTVNDTPEHFTGIGLLAKQLGHIIGIDVIPYHSLGNSKYEKLGQKERQPVFPLPAETDIQDWILQIQQVTPKPVKQL